MSESEPAETAADQSQQLVKQPCVTLLFDPYKNEDLKVLFEDDIARTLWLLWRPGHIVGDDFTDLCMSVARRIRENQPKTVDKFRGCFPTSHHYWMPNDVQGFCETALPWFTGEREIGFKIQSV